jgi:peptidoglycan/xylan/chitin deacetylase (PgdA/CDA1 family)
MLRSARRLQQDIEATQRVLSALGVRPLLFRPPVGITGPRLGPVLDRIGLAAVTFSCRPYDGGNRRVDRLAARVLRRLQPGQILLLHDVPPKEAGDRATWQDELDRLFRVLSRGKKVVPLAQLLDKAVTATGSDQA